MVLGYNLISAIHPFIHPMMGVEMPTLTLSENPAPVNSEVTCSCAGFEPNTQLHITQTNPESEFFFSQTTDADGNLDFGVPTDIPGDMVVKVYNNEHGNKFKLAAQITLTVS